MVAQPSGNEKPQRPQDDRAARRARRSLARRQDISADPPSETSTGTGNKDGSDDATTEVTAGGAENLEDGLAEEIHEDDLCPICQLLLHDPVMTTCHHTLCKFCMATWASVSLAQPMIVVDVDEEPAEFDPVSDLQARCPMCRTLTTALPSPARLDELKSKYPLAYAEREAEVSSESGSGRVEGGESIQTITVYIGNRHQSVPPATGNLEQNTHDWTFFVRPSRTDIVKEVHIFLHPTFRQNHVIRRRPPYQISRLGWGTFTITASVILKAGYSWVSDDAQNSPDGAVKGSLPLEWTLDFDGFGGKGSMGRCRLKVKHDLSQ